MESCASTNGSIRATKACLVKVVAVLTPPSRTALQEHSSTPCAKPTASKHPSNRWHRSRTIAVWPNPLPRAQSGCLTHSSPEGAAGDSPAPLPKGREPEVRVPFGPGVQRRKARQNAGSPLANPSILSLPCIGVQNLSPTPLLPCLQWVAPFLQSRFRRGSRIPGCPKPWEVWLPTPKPLRASTVHFGHAIDTRLRSRHSCSGNNWLQSRFSLGLQRETMSR